ncbi:Aldehyde dehydrogenase family 9 member A1-B [Salmo salar]|uniref:Aldehyde dehydrogenase family 9 member A1-B n=1 Tax=Salmo salar TaxID=8030 RepID=B9EPT9_SALSA|nr:Aldehyde dehydrogenase family 9 member A1-B [Salmo salar]ACM09536.1 Aldehyde dehydrogenase family 9 member A1-B [Salmo salar]|eukprot:NP_001140080.1 Aldehyde dehydrogenase family 9 member A1-B [Salmo salar]
MFQKLVLFRRLRPAALLSATLRCASSGTVDVKVPLNFWCGDRVKIRDVSTTEPVYEPATGSYLVSKEYSLNPPSTFITIYFIRT